MGNRLPLLAVVITVCAGSLWAADETSSSDKLRILYSNRFTFDDRGVPLLTVEIMGGQKEISLSGRGGLTVNPDGDGGASIKASDRWVVRLENGKPAATREWTIVARHRPENEDVVNAAFARWKQLGYTPSVFEVGTVFGVEGEVIDSREALVAVSPMKPGRGAAKARAIARKHKIKTAVHTELVERPSGTVIARSGSIEIRNPSVLWFTPSSASGTVSVADVVIGNGGSQLETSRENRRYFGAVYVAVGTDGKLVVVNAIATDKLLAGLVPSETFPDAHLEALKAQAIAARTELLEKIGTRHFGDPFLLCSNQHCQVYSGAGKEHPRTTKAVNETRGQVLMSERGTLVDARYSANCGGHAEDKDHIWGGEADPHLRAHVDSSSKTKPNQSLARHYAGGVTEAGVTRFLRETGGAFCASTKYSKGRYRWNKTVSVSALTKRVAAKYPAVGTIRRLTAKKRGRSGRISVLEIQGSRGTAKARGDLHIRLLLGGLRSSLFTVRQQGDSFVFTGAGFGHGVGMCQVGAIGMAEKRNSFRDILYHYYAGSRLRRLY